MTYCRIFMIALFVTVSASAAPIKTEVVRRDGKWALLRDGKPYFIRGVAGGGPKAPLVDLGANSFRTWSTDHLDAQLDEAQKLGLSVTVGIWLGQERQGFKYDDPKQVADQLGRAREVILKYKNHSAVLLCSLGNELEGYKADDNAAIWRAVHDIAAMAK